MARVSPDGRDSANPATNLIRLGGIAGVLAGVIVIVVNFIFVDIPPPAANAPLAEIRTYIADQVGIMRIGNGLRNFGFFLLPLFAVGAYSWVGSRTVPLHGWSVLGLLGITTVCAVGTVANSAETIALWHIDTLAEQPELLTMLWSLSTVLFNVVMVAWAVAMVGFSMAGRVSGTMPKWLTVVGLITGITGLLAGICISWVVTGGWAEGIAFVAFVLMVVWIWCMSVLMLRAVRSAKPAT